LTRDQYFKREAIRKEAKQKAKVQSSKPMVSKKKLAGEGAYKAMFEKKMRLRKMLELGKVDWSMRSRRKKRP